MQKSKIGTFPLGEIPVKLRCALCNNLAIDAFRLPCCEQSICGECQAKLPSVCQICDHTPLEKDNCKPNNALRTTVAVFIRTAEKKFLLSQQKSDTPPVAPVTTSNQDVFVDIVAEKEKAPAEESTSKAGVNLHKTQDQKQEEPNQSTQDSTATALAANLSLEDGNTLINTTKDAVKNGGNGSEHGHHINPNWASQTSVAVPQQDFVGNDYQGYQGWANYNNPSQGMAQYNGQMWNTFDNDMMNMSGVQGAQGGYPQGGFVGNMNGGVAAAMGNGVGFHGGMSVPGHGAWNEGWNMDNDMGGGYNSGGIMNEAFYNGAGGYNHQTFGNHQLPAQQYQNHGFQGNDAYVPPYQRQAYPRGGGFTQSHGSNFQDRQNFNHYNNHPNPQHQFNHHQPHQGHQSRQVPHEVEGDNNTVKVLVAPTNEADEIDGQMNEAPDVVEKSPIDVAPVADETVFNGDPQVSLVSPAVNDIVDPPLTTDMNSTNHVPAYSRGGGQFYRGAYRGFRGGYRGGINQPYITPHEPVSMEQETKNVTVPGVEGAPTGPKAMRDRGRGRGRGIIVNTGRGSYTGINTASSPDHRHDRSRSRSIVDANARNGDYSPNDTLQTPLPTDAPTHTAISENVPKGPQRDYSKDHRSKPTSPRAQSQPRSASQSPKRKKHNRRSRSRRRSSRSRSRSKDRDERKKDRDRERNRSRHRRRHRHKSPSDKSRRKIEGSEAVDEGTGEPTTSRDHEKSKDRDRHSKDKSRDQERDRDRSRDRDRDRERDRDRDRSKDRDKDKDRRARKRSSSRDRHRSHHKRTKHDTTNATGNENEDKNTNGASKKSKDNKAEPSSRSSRKHSYKYDDEESPAEYERRIEREREEERWGKR